MSLLNKKQWKKYSIFFLYPWTNSNNNLLLTHPKILSYAVFGFVLFFVCLFWGFFLKGCCQTDSDKILTL